MIKPPTVLESRQDGARQGAFKSSDGGGISFFSEGGW